MREPLTCRPRASPEPSRLSRRLTPPSRARGVAWRGADGHIIQPSPFFRGEFVTLAGGAVTLQQGAVRLHKPVSLEARIVGSETVINDDFKSFSVLLIDRPLSAAHSPVDAAGGAGGGARDGDDGDATDPLSVLRQLLKLPSCARATDSIVAAAADFNDAYYLLLDSSVGRCVRSAELGSSAAHAAPRRAGKTQARRCPPLLTRLSGSCLATRRGTLAERARARLRARTRGPTTTADPAPRAWRWRRC